MTTNAEAIALVRRYANLGRTKDLEQLPRMFTDDFTEHSANGVWQGLGPLREFLRSVWEWMPDIEVSIERIFANQGADGEPWVGASVTLRGTLAADGRFIEMPEVWIFRFRNNRISARWSVYEETESEGSSVGTHIP